MAELSREDVLHILQLIDTCDFDYFELESGELKLTVSKTPFAPGARAAGAGPGAASQGPGHEPVEAPHGPGAIAQPPGAAASGAAATAGGPGGATAGRGSELLVPLGLTPVRTEMVGTYYAQSEPGAPPYVEVGARVEADTIVGLIEGVHAGACRRPPGGGRHPGAECPIRRVRADPAAGQAGRRLARGHQARADCQPW